MDDSTNKLIHDLCSPLDVIKGFLRAIEKIEIPKEHREYLMAAIRSAEKMERVIEGQAR